MDRRSSSEIRSLRGPSEAPHDGGHGWGAAALAVLAVGSAAMLGASPLFAIGAAPLTFGATDAAAAVALGSPSPNARVRVVARALASAAWGGAASTIVATRGSGGGSDGASAAVRLTLLAMFLAIGAIVGSFGSATGSTPARGESPLVGVLDVLTTAWAFFLALASHEAEAKTRILMVAGVALALCLRALLVARVAAWSARAPEDTRLPAIGFVAWLAVASIACSFSSTPLTWSGLGAALLLTVAAALAESRRKRPLVLFLRGSLACAFAAMLGVATFLAS